MKLWLTKTDDGKMFITLGGRQSQMTRDHAVELLSFLTIACFCTQKEGLICDLDLADRSPNLCLHGGSVFPTEKLLKAMEAKNEVKKGK